MNMTDDDPKNMWLTVNLERTAFNTFSHITDFNTPMDMRDFYQRLADLMSLRSFTVDSLMNIPIQMEQRDAEKLVEKVFCECAERAFDYTVKDARHMNMLSIPFDETSRRMELVATAAPKSFSAMRKAVKKIEELGSRNHHMTY